MNIVWTRNLKNPAEKKEFEDYVRSSQRLIDRIHEILSEEEEKLTRLEVGPKAFESPSWAYMQAYYNGFRACLRLLRKLFTLDQKEKNV